MKRSDSRLFRRVTVVVILAWAIFPACRGYAQDDSAALMLEVSPVEGGSVNLSPGVHTFDRDSEVTLNATPKAGFQFVCWLGNVTNARNSSTSVFLDTPKIIIAVFERSKFDEVEVEQPPDLSAGGGGLRRSPGESGSRLSGAGGRRPPGGPSRPRQDVPVPDEDDTGEDPPAPIPEPASIAFMLAGALAIVKRSRRKNITNKTAII